MYFTRSMKQVVLGGIVSCLVCFLNVDNESKAWLMGISNGIWIVGCYNLLKKIVD